MFLLPCEVSRTLELGQEVPVPLVQFIRPQPFRSRLVRQQQHPRVIRRPPDPGGLRGGRQVHPWTGDGRHLFPLRLDQVRGRQVLLPCPRQGPTGLQLHLGLGQLLLIALQLLDQLHLRQDPAILPQHPEVVQLRGQGQPPTLPRKVMGQILGGQPPGDLPHDLQLPRRQGHDAAKFSLQFLGRQDLHPPSPIQTPGLDDLAIQSLDRRALDLARSLGRHTAPQIDLQAVLLGGGQHRVRGLRPAALRLGHPGHVLPVVPRPPPIRRLRRGKGHRMGVEVNLPPSVLRMEVREGEGSGLVPFPHASPHSNPNRFPLHLCDMGSHHRPQNVPSDLRVILQALAQLCREGDQRFLGLPEQPAPLGELVPLQVVPHRQLPQQLRGWQLLLGWIPAHLAPEVRIDGLGFHLAIPAQVSGADLQPSGFLRFLEMTPEIHDDPSRRTHAGAIVVSDHQVHVLTPSTYPLGIAFRAFLKAAPPASRRAARSAWSSMPNPSASFRIAVHTSATEPVRVAFTVTWAEAFPARLA